MIVFSSSMTVSSGSVPMTMLQPGSRVKVLSVSVAGPGVLAGEMVERR